MDIYQQDERLLAKGGTRCEPRSLPSGYVQAHAIHTSQQYMSMGLVISTADTWEVTCARDNDTSGNLPILGTGNSKTDSNMALWLNASTNLVEFTFGDGGNASYKVTTSAYDVKQFHTYKMELATGKAWVDGTYIGQASRVSSIPHPKDLVLFGCWRGSAIFSKWNGAMQECKITRNGQVVRHYVPVGNGDLDSYSRLCELTTGTLNTITGALYWWDYATSADYEVSAGGAVTISAGHYFGSTVIDWGDGNTDTLTTTGGLVATNHTYADAGTYTVTVTAPYSMSTMMLTGNASETTPNTTLKKINWLKTSGASPQQYCLYASTLNQDWLPDTYIIGNASYVGCASLNPRMLPPSAEYIRANAFAQCTALAVDALPPRLRFLGSSAFAECTALQFDALPSTLETLQTGSLSTGAGRLVFQSEPSTIHQLAISSSAGITDIYVPWGEGEVANAPWGATGATVHYCDAGYIRDGLMLWLDGINNTRAGHDSSVTGWEDLSGNGFDFAPRNSGKSPTINADSYSGFAADTFLTCGASALVAQKGIATVGTIEVVIDPTGGTGHVFGFPNTSGNNEPLSKVLVVRSSARMLNVAARLSTATNSRYALTGIPSMLANGVNSISVTYSGTIGTIRGYVDGTQYQLAAGESTGWGNNGGVVDIGNRIHTGSSTSYPYSGKIYCIRYYNRVLTKEERFHNRLVDARRFGTL